MTTNYVMAIMYLMPDARLSITGTDISYEDIVWQDERPMPTKAECEAIYPQAQYENDYAQIQRERERRYEQETDGLFFDAMREDGDLTDWKAACEVIKSELPYPAKPS